MGKASGASWGTVDMKIGYQLILVSSSRGRQCNFFPLERKSNAKNARL